jgi:hypothetical protein
LQSAAPPPSHALLHCLPYCVCCQAFVARLKKDLNMTPDKLLLPENKEVLTRVLQV